MIQDISLKCKKKINSQQNNLAIHFDFIFPLRREILSVLKFLILHL